MGTTRDPDVLDEDCSCSGECERGEHPACVERLCDGCFSCEEHCCGVRLTAEVERLTEAVQRVRDVCADTVWLFDVGEHAGVRPDGSLPFVEVADVLKAVDGAA